MIIDCVSDPHGYYPELEGGDLLIVAGDLTARDTKDELLYFHSWVTKQKYKKTIIIAGNHDNTCVKGYPFYNRSFAVDGIVMPHNEIEYLCDSGTEFERLKIWGSPWTKTFKGINPHCKAFTVDTEEELDKIFYRIPNDVDILITHEAPYGILDQIDYSEGDSSAMSVGSRALIYHSRMRQPKLHIFGHIHESYGMDNESEEIIFVNASHVNEKYQPVNKPIRVIL